MSTCITAAEATFNRLTEILTYLEANLKIPTCGDDYCEALANILTELQAISVNTGGGVDPVTVVMTNGVNDSGTVAANWASVSFINQGAVPCTVGGVPLNAAARVDLGGFGLAPTNAIAWVSPAGGDLLIVEARR